MLWIGHWYWVLALGAGCWYWKLALGAGHRLLPLDAGQWAAGTDTGHWHWVLGAATGWAVLLRAGQWSLMLGADSSAGQCHWALVLGTGQCHWVLGMGHWALSVGAGWGCVPRVPPWPHSPHPGVPQPQDHRGHRLSRGAFHRHRHHHRLLLHVLLLLLVPAPAALPHTPARCGARMGVQEGPVGKEGGVGLRGSRGF